MAQQETQPSLQTQVEALQHKCDELENQKPVSTNPLGEIVKPVAKLAGVLGGMLGGMIDGEDPVESGKETASKMGEIVDVIFEK